MTFIPSIQSITDTNNSTTYTGITVYEGDWTKTNGYESICINIVCNNDSTPNGLQLEFSRDASNVSKTISDTFFKDINFSKTYNIIDIYYRIKFNPSTSSTVNITTRLLVSTQTETSQNNFYSSNDSMIDAFGKLRVTNPYTLLDIKFPIQPPSQTSTTEFLNNAELICTSNNNNVNYTQTTSGNGSRLISVSGSSNGYFKSQSRKYCNYQPGKSMLVLCSGIINAGSNENVKTKIGFFDDYNGLYFQWDSSSSPSVMSVCLINNGTPTSIQQNLWNIDPMDGYGTSTLNLDFTKAQLFVIDFEWLSVGRIRFGFYAFGKINYCHQITNLNNLTLPYMQSANLPIRYELEGISNVNHIGSLLQICSTIISEGGYNPQGRPFTASNNFPPGNNISSNESPLLAIRGGGVNYYHQNIIPLGLQLLNITNTNDPILYRVRLFLSPINDLGGNFAKVSDYSVVQYATTFTATIDSEPSIIIEEGYFTGRGTSEFNNLSDVFSNVLQLTSNVNNVADILIITAKIQTGNAKIACSIQWQEIY
jgi:hypothetical protein